jgi:acetyl-CoA synthetase
MTEGRDFWWDEEAEKVPSYCPCEPVGAEDPLFILYVSLAFGGEWCLPLSRLPVSYR